VTRALAVLVASLVLGGCQKEAEQAAPSSNPGFRVERLFEHDGCTVYRFYDDRTVYFVRCGGEARTEWNTSQSCGKGCIKIIRHQVPTGEVRP
jgi:hypothetical protein